MVAPGESRVEPVEQLRGGRAGRAHACAPLVGVRDHPPPVPRGHEAERLGIGRLDPCPLDVRVEVPDVDEPRAAVVGLGGDRTRERLVPELGVHEHRLPRLDVGAVHGEPGEWLEAGRIHREAILPAARIREHRDGRAGGDAVPGGGGDRRRDPTRLRV